MSDGRETTCEVCGCISRDPSNEIHNDPIHRLRDRITALEVDLQRHRADHIRHGDKLSTPSPSLTEYERILGPLRAEAAMNWWDTGTGDTCLREACEKLHARLRFIDLGIR